MQVVDSDGRLFGEETGQSEVDLGRNDFGGPEEHAQEAVRKACADILTWLFHATAVRSALTGEGSEQPARRPPSTCPVSPPHTIADDLQTEAAQADLYASAAAAQKTALARRRTRLLLSLGGSFGGQVTKSNEGGLVDVAFGVHQALFDLFALRLQVGAGGGVFDRNLEGSEERRMATPLRTQVGIVSVKLLPIIGPFRRFHFGPPLVMSRVWSSPRKSRVPWRLATGFEGAIRFGAAEQFDVSFNVLLPLAGDLLTLGAAFTYHFLL